MASSCRRRHHSIIPWFPERLLYCELLSGVEEITRKENFYLVQHYWISMLNKYCRKKMETEKAEKYLSTSVSSQHTSNCWGKLCRLSGLLRCTSGTRSKQLKTKVMVDNKNMAAFGGNLLSLQFSANNLRDIFAKETQPQMLSSAGDITSIWEIWCLRMQTLKIFYFRECSVNNLQNVSRNQQNVLLAADITSKLNFCSQTMHNSIED